MSTEKQPIWYEEESQAGVDASGLDPEFNEVLTPDKPVELEGEQV